MYAASVWMKGISYTTILRSAFLCSRSRPVSHNAYGIILTHLWMMTIIEEKVGLVSVNIHAQVMKTSYNIW